jgi:spermidine synthase
MQHARRSFRDTSGLPCLRTRACCREPLLAVLRTSPDFRPAYDPLLRMSQALARSDATAARLLLGELMRLQPPRPAAAQALQQMSEVAPT